jgi:general secretion pathway protein N
VRLRFALPVGLLLLVVAVVALAPARLVDAQLVQATDGRLRLADAAGTVWRGDGVVTDARGALRLPVTWQLSPLALLKGTAALDVTPQGEIVAAGDGVSLRNVRIDVPARALDALATRGITAAFGGDLRLDAAAFRYDGRSGDGAVDLRWDRARVAFNGAIVDLGTITARMTPRGADLTGTFTSTGGALRSAGDVVFANGEFGITATLTPAGPLPPELMLLLGALGRADANGAIRVAWRGVLR